MKNKIKSNLKKFKETGKRFPLVIAISIILALNLIYTIELMPNVKSSIVNSIMKVNIILVLGLLMSISIGLLNEKSANFKSNIRKSLPYILGVIILFVYYIFFLKNINMISIGRSIGMFIILFLGIFIVHGISIQPKYELYVSDLIKSILTGVMYSSVLTLGLYFIYFTISELFEINIVSKVYLYTAIISYIPIFTFVTISRVPEVGISYRESENNKVFLILIKYIIIPLLYIYTAILYMYFLKVLTTWSWPKGLVSHLVIWYSIFSLLILFFTNSEEKDNVIYKFRKIFPKLLLPILIMMFMSIGQRVLQYGITENRYYLSVLGLWTFIMMLYYGFQKEVVNVFLPISFMIIVLISQFGPLSAYSVSKRSQNKRFEKVLIDTGILEGKSFKRKFDVLEENQIEISNILYYFDNNHSISDIKVLPDNFRIDNMLLIFGFKYKPDIGYGNTEDERFYYSMDLDSEVLDVKSYENLMYLKSWNDRNIEIDNIEIFYKDDGPSIIIKNKENNTMERINLLEDIERIHRKNSNKTFNMDFKDMAYNHKINDLYKIRIVYTNISGWVNNADNLKVDSMEMVILLNRL